MTVDWKDGRLLTLGDGQTATAKELVKKQIHGFFFWNKEEGGKGGRVKVVWANDKKPEIVPVPPHNASDPLPASVLFVSGSESQRVSVTPSTAKSSEVCCLVCSLSMPNNTDGIDNQELLAGESMPFLGVSRFWSVPASSPHRATIESSGMELTVVRFRAEQATVIVLNHEERPDKPRYFKGVGEAAKKLNIEYHEHVFPEKFTGNGRQTVWVAAVKPLPASADMLPRISLECLSPDEASSAREAARIARR